MYGLKEVNKGFNLMQRKQNIRNISFLAHPQTIYFLKIIPPEHLSWKSYKDIFPHTAIT